jgi:competence ComEA-like helix-hairpin-helix protein
MKFFSYFQSFGFTRNEIKVILLLSATFLLGLAIRFYNSSALLARTPKAQFDYSVSDSIFEARSKNGPSGLASGLTNPDSIQRGLSTTPSRTEGKGKSVININTGSKNELTKLPGIGGVYAERIIEYRTKHGPFKSPNDLLKVKGIGKKRLEQMYHFVSVK